MHDDRTRTDITRDRKREKQRERQKKRAVQSNEAEVNEHVELWTETEREIMANFNCVWHTYQHQCRVGEVRFI